MPPCALVHLAQAVTAWAMVMERPGPVWVVMSPMRMTPPPTPALGTAPAAPRTPGLPPDCGAGAELLRTTLDPCAPGAAVGVALPAAAPPVPVSPPPESAVVTVLWAFCRSASTRPPKTSVSSTVMASIRVKSLSRERVMAGSDQVHAGCRRVVEATAPGAPGEQPARPQRAQQRQLGEHGDGDHDAAAEDAPGEHREQGVAGGMARDRGGGTADGAGATRARVGDGRGVDPRRAAGRGAARIRQGWRERDAAAVGWEGHPVGAAADTAQGDAVDRRRGGEAVAPRHGHRAGDAERRAVDIDAVLVAVVGELVPDARRVDVEARLRGDRAQPRDVDRRLHRAAGRRRVERCDHLLGRGVERRRRPLDAEAVLVQPGGLSRDGDAALLEARV